MTHEGMQGAIEVSRTKLWVKPATEEESNPHTFARRPEIRDRGAGEVK